MVCVYCYPDLVGRCCVGVQKRDSGMAETIVTFTVEGIPVPQGSKTVAKAGSKVWLRDANAKKLKPWRALVAEAARATGATFDCAVFVAAVFYMPKPKTVKRFLPSVKPDLDKLFRALGDGMTDGGLLVDDSRIVSKWVHKRYASGLNPVGVKVLVMEADDER